MLELTGLTVRLRQRTVLDGLSLAIRAGELVAICGANGAGKSTLLKAILQEVPATGRLRLNGIDLAAARPAALAPLRAVLPQESDTAFGFTLADILRMGREAGDFAARPEVDRAALAAVGLLGREDDDIRSLSGGERQRAHLARALAQVWEPVGPRGPRWLMLDEPVASLDLGHQLQVMRLARGFADAGGGVLAVMHDLNLSAMFADRMVLLAGGKIAADGPPARVMDAPRLSAAYGCRAEPNRIPPQDPWLLPQTCGGDDFQQK
jgi:iron complex transport system ATP-binding protein